MSETENDSPGTRDPAKPREGRTEKDVRSRFEELRKDGFRGFDPATKDASFVKAALNYYNTTGDEQRAERLKLLTRRGHLLVGPDEKQVFYGANNDVIYLVAANDNPNIAATLIHELNEGTHEEDEEAELEYLENRARGNPFIEVLIEKNEEEFAEKPWIRPHHGIHHSLRMWSEVEGLADRFDIDMGILAPAVFLHDIGIIHTDKARGYCNVSVEYSEPILREIGLPEEKITKILTMIKEHDNYNVPKASAESQLLFYADYKEALGIKGALRYLRTFRERGVPEEEIGSRVLENMETRFDCISNGELKELLKPAYEFSRRYFTNLAEDREGRGRGDLIESLSSAEGLSIDREELVSIFEQKLLESGFAPCNVNLTVGSPLTSSRRIIYNIDLILKRERRKSLERQKPVFSCYVKVPNNEAEGERAEYAARVALGPEVVFADRDIVIEERLDEMRDIRHMGICLTNKEARVLGRKLARAFNRMITDDFVLFHSNILATHIIICGLGTSLEVKFIDWSNSIELKKLKSFSRNAAMVNFVKETAFLLREELSSAGANLYAWKSFVQTLLDPGWIVDGELRARYKESVMRVEKELSKQDVPGEVTPAAEHWQRFFEFSGSLSVLKEFDRQYLYRMLLVETGTPLSEVKNSLILKMEKAGIKDEKCAMAVINDIIERLEIEKYLGINLEELREILESILSSMDLTGESIDEIVEATAGILKGKGSTLIVSSRVRDVISSRREEIFRDVKVQGDQKGVEEIINEIFHGLQEIELRKIDFKISTGITGTNRPWADDLTVYGPEPERKVLITYHIKKSHSSPPGREVERSKLASELHLGPQFVYGDYERGIIVEEWLDKNAIGDRAPGLSPEERNIVGQLLVDRFYLMFDIRREVRVTHKFDNLPYHVYIVGQGRDIDVLFIDWGKDCIVNKSNREYLLKDHLQSMIEQIRQHLGPQATAHFIANLKRVAARKSPFELEYYNKAYNNVREAMTTRGSFKESNKKFFEEVDRHLDELATAGVKN